MNQRTISRSSVPSDGEAPPIQSFYIRDDVAGTNNHNVSGISTNVGGEVRRQAAGEYTWMIMLTPEPMDHSLVSSVTSLSAAQATAMHPPLTEVTTTGSYNAGMRSTLNAAATNEYVASVLILKNRQGTIPIGRVPAAGITTGSDEAWQTNERILEIVPGSFVGGSGAATGEIQIQQVGGTREDAEERTLKARNGDWICLVRRMPVINPSTSLPRGDVYLWYKVVMVDEVVDSNGSPTGNVAPFTRYLTLSGPDWPVDAHEPTHAIMVDGVVGVYTRNVRLQSPNVWSP